MRLAEIQQPAHFEEMPVGDDRQVDIPIPGPKGLVGAVTGDAVPVRGGGFPVAKNCAFQPACTAMRPSRRETSTRRPWPPEDRPTRAAQMAGGGIGPGNEVGDRGGRLVRWLAFAA